VEDSDSDAQLFLEYLSEVIERRYEVLRVPTLEKALERLAKDRFDAVLIDLSLPDSHGIETFADVHKAAAKLPILVLSGLNDEDVALQAVREGAQDYLVKSQISPDVLHRSITYAIERARAEEHLKDSLREKDMLLKEIHHRVKNNLQVITSLLSLQSRHLRDDQAKTLFDESRNRILSMAMVHEELYKSGDLDRISFVEYIRSLVKNLLRSFGIDGKAPIKLNVDVADVYLRIDTAIPCGLIINELISNSLKHAFPGGRTGTISVTLKRIEPETFNLRIADDGVGMSRNIDIKQSGTLGLELVSALVDQIGGVLTTERDGGTSFSITFKAEQISSEQ
jgi:two-component sensor histidine kinase